MRDLGRRPATSPPASSSSRSSTSTQPSSPRWCGELSGPRASRAARRRRRRARGRSSSCRRRRRAPRRSRRYLLRLEQRLEQARRRARSWPISGWASSALRASTGSRVDRRLRREPLVRGDVLHEPEQLRRERRLRQRLGRRRGRPAPAPRRRRRRRARRACRRCGCRPRARRRRRRRATRRARAPPRCSTRRRAARAAPASRSAPGRGRARAARARSRPRPAARGMPSCCSASTRVVRVEVAQVVGRDRAELLEQPPRQVDLRRRARRRARRAAPAARRAPSSRTARTQVRWLSPTWSTTTRAGSTPSSRANERWKPIATLQRPTARWPASSSARVTIPTGFVKSTIQAPGRGQLAHALGDLEHDRHGAHRLREAAGAGRLLADAAARERHGLVVQPRRLPADADLDEHEVGAVERAVEVVGRPRAAPRSPARSSIRARQPADDLAPLGVDVVQHELAHVEPSRSRTAPRRARACTSTRAPMTASFIPSPRSA